MDLQFRRIRKNKFKFKTNPKRFHHALSYSILLGKGVLSNLTLLYFFLNLQSLRYLIEPAQSLLLRTGMSDTFYLISPSPFSQADSRS